LGYGQAQVEGQAPVMSWTIRFDPEAEIELERSAFWYQAQRIGLELRFLDAIDDTLVSILFAPRGYQVIFGKFRQAPVKGFPFVVVYALVKDVILVVSVFHTSRDPKRKMKRRLRR